MNKQYFAKSYNHITLEVSRGRHGGTTEVLLDDQGSQFVYPVKPEDEKHLALEILGRPDVNDIVYSNGGKMLKVGAAQAGWSSDPQVFLELARQYLTIATLIPAMNAEKAVADKKADDALAYRESVMETYREYTQSDEMAEAVKTSGTPLWRVLNLRRTVEGLRQFVEEAKQAAIIAKEAKLSTLRQAMNEEIYGKGRAFHLMSPAQKALVCRLVDTELRLDELVAQQ